jgi:hypothetical protein
MRPAAQRSKCVRGNREANTQGDLQQVILDTSWKNGTLTPAQVDEVRVLLSQAYMQLFAGYRFSRILDEMVDELDASHVRGQRFFRVADRYEDPAGALSSGWSRYARHPEAAAHSGVREESS